MIPVNKYDSYYNYKITLGCGLENINQKGLNKLEMIYMKRSANLTPITHLFNDKTD